MVMKGWSVHVTTLFSLVNLNKPLVITLCTYCAKIKLATTGSAVRHASVVRHVTDSATRPGIVRALVALFIVMCVLVCCVLCWSVVCAYDISWS